MAAPYINRSWNAKDFGAYGDGSFNDAQALQEALDFMHHRNNEPNFQDQEGGKLFLPRGTYKINSPLVIKSGCVIEGEGQGTIIVYEETGDYAIELRAFNDTDNPGFAKQIVIRDLAIYTTSSHGIGVPNANCQALQCLFENLYFSTKKRGIDLTDRYVANCAFRNLVGRNMGMGLIFLNNGSVCVGERLNIGAAVRSGFLTNETSAAITFLGGTMTLRDCLVESLFEEGTPPVHFSGPYYKFGGPTNQFGGMFINNYAERNDEANIVSYVFQKLYNGVLDIVRNTKSTFDTVHAFVPVLDLQSVSSNITEKFSFTGDCKLTIGHALVANWPFTYPSDSIVFLSVYKGTSSSAFQACFPAALLSGSNTLPDGVLSTNVPLLNAANAFTNAPQSITKTVTGAGISFLSLTPTWSGTISGTCNDIFVNAGESTFSGTHNLMDLQAQNTSRFSITNTGLVTLKGSIAGDVGTSGIGGTGTPDLAKANAFAFDIGDSSYGILAPSNSRVGMSYVIYLSNNNLDPAALTWNSAYTFGNLTAPTSLDNGQWVILHLYCQSSSNHIVTSINGNY